MPDYPSSPKRSSTTISGPLRGGVVVEHVVDGDGIANRATFLLWLTVGSEDLACSIEIDGTPGR